MNTKENILNSWILIEQLSEGNVNTKHGDKNAVRRFDPTKSVAHGRSEEHTSELQSPS